MEHRINIENWQAAIVSHSDVKKGFEASTAEELLQSGKKIISAEVPGNLELDLEKAGLLENLYYGDNILKAQKTEHLHMWYFASFDFCAEENSDAFLCFQGIDTASEIYLDGVLLGKTENMLIPYTFSLQGISDGRHEIVVHIIPAVVYARQFDLPMSCIAGKYNNDSLVLRKAPYMYGWDIMPRTVSAGLWKPVTLVFRPKNRIEEYYISTVSVNSAQDKAKLRLSLRITTDEDLLSDFTYKIEGRCGDSTFSAEETVYGTVSSCTVTVEHPSLWMPKNYGEPNLYDVHVTLLLRGEVCDNCNLRFGIRIAELERTSIAGDDGEFCFRVNGQKIFVLGTNWVPTDAFPSRHKDFQPRGLEMIDDLGCNMVRCWGGNVYPDHPFYDFCDEHGILVWQDFSMACGIYPNDERMSRLIREEATAVVKAYRNHSSLALWSGDNECDETRYWRSQNLNGKPVNPRDPNTNRLTREILSEVIREHDFARPYLPSSPYYDERVFSEKGNPAEAHLWGPRDFFKGKYYSTAPAHFASETGYHGCPSPASLKRFIPNEHLLSYGTSKRCDDRYWLTHAACMEPAFGTPYSYRISLMTSQVERIFGEVPQDLNRYALESQISQAEAKKYFIERFRISKWRRTGILWWNLIDGWPQISDAVVDWYGCKKLAYSYIKRSQNPFCMMIDEPKDGTLTLCASNDTRDTVSVSYTVSDLVSDRTILTGETACRSDATVRITEFPEDPLAFYLIEWQGSAVGKNHYKAAISHRFTLESYFICMQKAGFDSSLEGFEGFKRSHELPK